MQQPQKLPPRPPRPPSPSPQGFGVGTALVAMQGIGASSSQAAAAAARARAAEQMAHEDAWKASNPDFKTPFASVEDAVSRLLPYHVFAEYEEDDICDTDGGDASAAAKSSVRKWDEEVEATQLKLIAEFEKQMLTFNVMVRQRGEGALRGEERLMLERALFMDERWETERVRAVIQHEEQQEAARTRLALAQAQAASAWPLVQPTATAWQQALAAAATARGEGISGFGGAGPMAAAQGVAMHPQQQDPGDAAGAWQMMQQQLALGVWPMFVVPRGEGSSSGQVRAPAAVQQEQAGGQTMSGAAAVGMLQPWWGSGAQRREQ